MKLYQLIGLVAWYAAWVVVSVFVLTFMGLLLLDLWTQAR